MNQREVIDNLYKIFDDQMKEQPASKYFVIPYVKAQSAKEVFSSLHLPDSAEENARILRIRIQNPYYDVLEREKFLREQGFDYDPADSTCDKCHNKLI